MKFVKEITKMGFSRQVVKWSLKFYNHCEFFGISKDPGIAKLS